MDFGDYRLGETDQLIELETAQDNHDLALAMFRQARREILIASYDLDRLVFDHEDIIQALSAFARDNRLSHVRILLQNPERAIKHGHRLITLAQRLSSSIQIHRPAEEHLGFADAFIVVDGIGVLRRKMAERFEGTGNFKAPIDGRDLHARFISMWELATPETRLRRLQL